MTDRELLQMALDALENAHANEPIWKTPIKEAIKALRARLAEPPKDLELPLVRLEEFLTMVKGSEGCRGRPVMRTEWPTEEKPWVKTYSGGKPNYTQPIEREPILPGGGIGRHPDIPIKVQDEREENYKSFAQSAQVLGITEPEPVAWMNPKEESDGYAFSFKQQGVFTVPLYTAPPKKEWQRLTDEEIGAMEKEYLFGGKEFDDEIGYWAVYRAIEAKLKEKNNAS